MKLLTMWGRIPPRKKKAGAKESLGLAERAERILRKAELLRPETEPSEILIVRSGLASFLRWTVAVICLALGFAGGLAAGFWLCPSAPKMGVTREVGGETSSKASSGLAKTESVEKAEPLPQTAVSQGVVLPKQVEPVSKAGPAQPALTDLDSLLLESRRLNEKVGRK